MKLNLHLPLNTTSFGQTSTMLARQLFNEISAGKRQDDDYSIYPLGNPDFSTQKLPEDFLKWLSLKINQSISSHQRTTPTFKLWHLNGSLESLSEKQTLLSFYELDEPTQAELNVARNNKTLFSSLYSISNFKNFGADCHHLPLAFDDFNFSKLDKKFFVDGRIVFNLCGKFEKRKNHVKIIQSWIKKFGNDPKYSLQCAIYNPFINQEGNNNVIMNILQGKKPPFNVNFFPFLQQNSAYNEYLNSANIIIGMSGGEGWGLPEFSSVCLGKHAVIMNAHAYKDWANNDNSVLVNSNGKIPAYDDMFFRKGQPFNQGNIFDFEESEFIESCEKAIQRVKHNPINQAGQELTKNFNKEKMLESIINYAT